MGTGFAALPGAPRFRLTNARVPLALATSAALGADREGFAAVDIAIEDGLVVSVVLAGTASLDTELPAFDCDGGIVLPRLVDIHTHLDKGHIWPRAANPDGTFTGALETRRAIARRTGPPRTCAPAWSSGCAAPSPTAPAAIRTHLDSHRAADGHLLAGLRRAARGLGRIASSCRR